MNNKYFTSKNNTIHSHTDIKVNEDTLRVFSSDQEELEYVNNYFNNRKNLKEENHKHQKTSQKYKNQPTIQYNQINQVSQSNSEYQPITITKEERLVLIQSIRYNDNFVMPFVAKPEIIESLNAKGFIEKKNDDAELFSVKKNVCLLFGMEGYDAFDEIVR